MNNKILFPAFLIAVFMAGCATNVPVQTKNINIAQPAAQTAYIPNYLEKGFVWPVRGEIISPFGSGEGKVRNKGIDIKANEGTIVRAAKGGRVVYCDQYLKGFGQTIIIDHGNSLESVYAYNSEISVKVGNIVAQNEKIARVGSTGRAKTPSLHFEIRKDGKPQDPIYYLR